jgi:hypothetical protein
MQLKPGTRIYYNGDMANRNGFGVITKREEANKYAPPQVFIKMDDGREMWIMEMAFSKEYLGHGGTRFVTEWAYKKWKSEQMKKLQEWANRKTV